MKSPLRAARDAQVYDSWDEVLAEGITAENYGKGPMWVNGDLVWSDGNVWSGPSITAINQEASSMTATSVASFDGVTGKATLPKTYILASDGDYIEFVAKLDEYQISANALAMLGEFGTNQNYLSPSFTAGNFTIRENTGAAKNIVYSHNPLEFQRYRLTQTSATVWTFAVNGVDVGTLVRADTIKIDNIGSGYTGNYCTCTFKELTISTATTGTLIIKNFAQELPKKATSISGVTYAAAQYDTKSLAALSHPIGVTTTTTPNKAISIYVPQAGSTNYLEYYYENTVDAAKNANVWRIKYLNIRTPVEFPFIWSTTRIITTASGEWENAVKIVADDDFFGGSSHGKDVKISNAIYIDGVSQNFDTFNMACGREIKLTQSSNCYKKVAGDYAAVNCAQSDREWLFDIDKLVINNTITWNTSEIINTAYLSMCPIIRSDGDGNVTAWGLSGNNPVPVDISSSGFTVTKSTNPTLEIYSDSSGLVAKTDVLSGWDKPNRVAWIDNSAPYNKLYNNFIGESSYTTTVGETLAASTQYTIKLTK